MKETFYLFEFVDGDLYEMTCAVSFKDAIWEISKYTGSGSELLLKCLKGFQEQDIQGMIDIFNHFSAYTIQKIYVIEKLLYDDMKGGVQN